MRLRVLVLDGDLSRRLRTVRALAAGFEVTAAQGGEDPVRAARRATADAVVIGASGRAADVLALVRALRTDVRPVRYVVVHGRGAPDPVLATGPGLADACAARDLDEGELVEALDGLAAGRPLPAPAPGGRLRKWVRLLSRSYREKSEI